MSSSDLNHDIIPPLIADLEEYLQKYIDNRLTDSKPHRVVHNSSLDLCYAQLADFMSQGKHIRPYCTWAGWFIAQLTPPTAENFSQLAHLGAACEFLHACALIHDDVIDQSSTRRSQPTVHEAFSQLHSQEVTSLTSDSLVRRHFGYSMAILVGDLALSLANQEIATLPPHNALWSTWNAMEHEVIAGQILDVSLAAQGIRDIEMSSLVNYFKTASYTFIRPLQLGAILAAASDEILTILSDVGSALGAAFQLQDDLLGIFSLSPLTGKAQGDDLISGKSTILVTEALQLAQHDPSPERFSFLEESIGNIKDRPHLEQVIQVLLDLGAKDRVEKRIQEYFVQVYTQMDKLHSSAECNPVGLAFLSYIINFIEQRTA